MYNDTMIQLKWVRSPIIFRAMHLDSFRKFRWVKEERIEKKTRGEMNLYRQIVYNDARVLYHLQGGMEGSNNWKGVSNLKEVSL